ncbi:hypothetical protein [Streptomyces lavendulae]|uniref:hypothetical protein n=1 Tax=Streptomyces lavendulae TaxID=1914 RepID=UPI0024A27784|nr:hypothetical protein [Streptomyces lavendulae]GLW00294.1 hypothetical protein Slala05_39250 [Streptomyces lavendulae subsp. lavendulae]
MNQLPLLDWGDHSHFDARATLPCCLCGKPTPMRSHAGEAVHKVCAEEWNAAHPAEPRRYTPPAPGRPQHDVGTWRFHNDGPTTPHLRSAVAVTTQVAAQSAPGMPASIQHDDLFAA